MHSVVIQATTGVLFGPLSAVGRKVMVVDDDNDDDDGRLNVCLVEPRRTHLN